MFFLKKCGAISEEVHEIEFELTQEVIKDEILVPNFTLEDTVGMCNVDLKGSNVVPLWIEVVWNGESAILLLAVVKDEVGVRLGEEVTIG